MNDEEREDLLERIDLAHDKLDELEQATYSRSSFLARWITETRALLGERGKRG